MTPTSRALALKATAARERSCMGNDYGGSGSTNPSEFAKRVHVELGDGGAAGQKRDYRTSNGEAMVAHAASAYRERVQPIDPTAGRARGAARVADGGDVTDGHLNGGAGGGDGFCISAVYFGTAPSGPGGSQQRQQHFVTEAMAAMGQTSGKRVTRILRVVDAAYVHTC